MRFSITSIATAGYQRNEETAAFILVCDLNGGENLRLSLYAQTGLQSSPKPERFIDPFNNIEDYGPLGDAFSLGILRPGSIEDRRVRMIHGNPRKQLRGNGCCNLLKPTYLQRSCFHPAR